MTTTEKPANESAAGPGDGSDSDSDASRYEAARVAFVQGDFARVRALTTSLESSLDHELRKKARALRTRVSIDPIAVAILVVSFLFLIAIAVRYLGESK